MEVVEGKGEGIACRKVARVPFKRMEQIVQQKSLDWVEICTVGERPRIKVINICRMTQLTMQSTSV